SRSDCAPGPAGDRRHATRRRRHECLSGRVNRPSISSSATSGRRAPSPRSPCLYEFNASRPSLTARLQALCRSITSGRFTLDSVVLREVSAARVEATRFGRYNLPRRGVELGTKGEEGLLQTQARGREGRHTVERAALLEARPDFPAGVGPTAVRLVCA